MDDVRIVPVSPTAAVCTVCDGWVPAVAAYGAADGGWWGAASCADERHAAQAIRDTVADMTAHHEWGYQYRTLADLVVSDG